MAHPLSCCLTSPLPSCERLGEVLDQILGGLDTDREPQQGVGDAETQPVLAREARVGGGRGAREEGVYAAQARGQRGNASRARAAEADVALDAALRAPEDPPAAPALTRAPCGVGQCSGQRS